MDSIVQNDITPHTKSDERVSGFWQNLSRRSPTSSNTSLTGHLSEKRELAAQAIADFENTFQNARILRRSSSQGSVEVFHQKSKEGSPVREKSPFRRAFDFNVHGGKNDNSRNMISQHLLDQANPSVAYQQSLQDVFPNQDYLYQDYPSETAYPQMQQTQYRPSMMQERLQAAKQDHLRVKSPAANLREESPFRSNMPAPNHGPQPQLRSSHKPRTSISPKELMLDEPDMDNFYSPNLFPDHSQPSYQVPDQSPFVNRLQSENTSSNARSYSCTYHGCTARFETPAKLQKHKREAHRRPLPSLSDVSFLKGLLPDNILITYKHEMLGHNASLQQNPRPPPKSSLGVSRSILPVTINGHTDDALPDTMSTCNVISADYAKTLAAKIDAREGSRHVFRNACGKAFKSIGTTTLDVAFPGEESKTYRQRFAVVANCAAKLIMGNPFLQLTQILTRFKHRLRKAATWNGWRLLYMDAPTQKLGCMVDSELVFANVDSGSDKDLASLEYARYREWDITPMPYGRGYVMLADGSVEKVGGYVDTCLTIRGSAAMKRFYILDGLVCDVLIGDDTIDSYDIFNKYQDSFVDIDTTFGHPDCHAIKYLEELDRAVEIVSDPNFTIPPTPTDAFLNQMKEKRIIKQRGTDILFPSKWRAKAIDHTYDLISNGLWTTMERSGTAEATARKQQEAEMATLSGNELLLKQQAGDRRVHEYIEKRRRLLDLKCNLERWKQDV